MVSLLHSSSEAGTSSATPTLAREEDVLTVPYVVLGEGEDTDTGPKKKPAVLKPLKKKLLEEQQAKATEAELYLANLAQQLDMPVPVGEVTADEIVKMVRQLEEARVKERMTKVRDDF